MTATTPDASAIPAILAPEGALAAAFERTEVAFFLARGDGSILRFNRAFRELVAVSDDELRGAPVLDFVHDEDQEPVAAALRELAAGSLRRFGGELRIISADRQAPVWVEVGVSTVAEGVLIGQLRDVTARRGVEEALRDSEALFRAAFDDAAVATLIVDPTGTVSRGNAAAASLFGYRANDLSGTLVTQLTHPDHRAETAAAIDALRAGAVTGLSLEKRYLHRDGRTIWGQATVAPVWTATRELRCFVVQVVDLSAIRTAEQKFKTVFDAAGIGISVGADGMLTETNGAYQRLLGYSADELSRMHYTDICHPDEIDSDRRLVEELLAGRKRSFTVERRYIRRDRQTVWVRVTVTMSPDGSFGIGLVEDISERRRLLARTVEAAEAERVALAADLHDGPIQHLTASAFRLDLLTNRLRRDGNAAAADLASAIRDEIAAEMESLRRMMVELRPPVMDERGVEAAIRELGQTVFADTDVTCTVESNVGARRLPAQLETALYRVTREAATNIRKHAGARVAEITLQLRNDTIQLTISDDGLGFDVSETPDDHLGLVSMRERIESAGGSVEIRSQRGAGTTIHAALPAFAEPALAP